VEVKSQEGQ